MDMVEKITYRESKATIHNLILSEVLKVNTKEKQKIKEIIEDPDDNSFYVFEME